MDIVAGPAVSQLLQRVASSPMRYRELLVCTPYLDDETADLVARLAVQAPAAHCGFTLVTRPDAARRVAARLPAPTRRWCRSIRIHYRLHAKVYIAMARLHRQTEAIVTSANLTLDGLHTNEELGVRLTGKCADERLAIASVKQAVHNWLH